MSERESKVESRKLKVTQALRALSTRVSNFAFRFSNLLACIPWRIVLGGAGVLFVAVWLLEHDAGLRREVALGQLKQQTAAQVTELRARADAALRAANEERARAIESLEARRRRLEREAEQLRQRLMSLREEERARVGQVATLPASELEQRVAARLDPGNFATRDSGFGTRASGSEEHVAGAQGQVSETRDSGLGVRGSGSEEPARLGGQASGVGARVSGKRVPDDQPQGPPEKDKIPDTWPSADGLKPGTPRVPSPESRVPSPDFVLTEEGARRVETAFLELEACRGQSAVKDGALGNCQEQVATQAAIASEMRKSLDDLNQAIRLKDEIAARTETLHRAELRAARGSWGSRFLRAVEYVGIGVVIGLVAR
jgi:hypothetical protein